MKYNKRMYLKARGMDRKAFRRGKKLMPNLWK